MSDEKIKFSVQLRKATKTIHDVSDALVNAKLGVTLGDDYVWAEGLLVFFEVFRFLEMGQIWRGLVFVGLGLTAATLVMLSRR